MSSRKKISERLPFVIPEIKEWPIYRLSQDKETFIKQIVETTMQNVLERFDTPEQLHNELKNVLYQEKIRLTKEPWKSDKPEEKIFWSEVKRKILLSAKEEDEALRFKKDKKILRSILKHYAQEIVANFEQKTYKFARTMLGWLLGRLMNASPGKKLRFLSKSRKTVYDKMKIFGPIDHIRNLAKKGTLIVVPTHFSNLDSPVIGFTLDAIGLPAFTYGAGINLFTLGVLSRWMNNLGAYKLDRRKKNAPYLQLLKNYSNIAIQRGTHSLFFPGGTRSRSGEIEKKLKLGLLGTAVEAQRQNLIQFPEETAQKIFVVPVVLNYHFVMEASALVNQHLSIKGKEQYLQERTEFSTSYSLIKLIYQFLTATAGMSISFGEPMDVFGNKVDSEGISYNNIDQQVNIKDYFLRNGEITEDRQRDGVYTESLGNKIVDQFFKYNIVLSSHLLAYVAFEMIKREYSHLDLFAILRIPADEISLDYDAYVLELERLKGHLLDLFADKKLILSESVLGDTDEMIKNGLNNLGVYHPQEVLSIGDQKNVITQDLKLLYYYHNRLAGYGLSKHFK